MIRIIKTILFALCMVLEVQIAAFADITKDKALSIAKMLVSSNLRDNVEIKGLEKYTAFQMPVVDAYKFSVVIPGIDPGTYERDTGNTDESGNDVKEIVANPRVTYDIWINANTGQVIKSMYSSFDFEQQKYAQRSKFIISDLKSKDEAHSFVDKYLKLAGYDPLEYNIENYDYSLENFNNFPLFSFSIATSKNIDGIGNVKCPNQILMELDAFTGDLYTFRLQKYPITSDVIKPIISADDAIKIALANCPQQQLKRINKTKAILSIHTSKSQTPLKQYFCWEVYVHMNDKPEDCWTPIPVVIDTQSGEILRW